MELKKLILKNFRSHQNLTLNFSSGVTAIIGSNGTGKSGIVEAVTFLFTGEGYGKTKGEMTRVGTASGYVIGHLEIDGETAILERHTDTAKVSFQYKGKVYKKSGEVAEIWDKLFQIDKHIVKNVIISNQGEIALLFDGDPSTREKLFQKIFLVPNTTKLRDIIWQKYIKTAPPEYMVKDSVQLSSDAQVQEEIVRLEQEELDALFVDEDGYNDLVARKAFLVAVEASKPVAKELLDKIPALEKQLEDLKAEQAGLKLKIASIPIDSISEELRKLEVAKAMQDMKDELIAKRDALVAPPEYTDDDLNRGMAVSRKMDEIRAGRNMRVKIVEELNTKLSDFNASGKAAGICPTCGTKLEDITNVIEHTKREIASLSGEIISLASEMSPLEFEFNELTAKSNKWADYLGKVQELAERLADYKDVNYSAEDYDLYSGVIAKHKEFVERDGGYDYAITAKTADLNSAKLKLAGVKVYDKAPGEYDAELEDVLARIQAASEMRSRIKDSEVRLATGKKELETLQQALSENTKLVESNAKRARYVSVLESLYDVFHTSKFPRALIHTYADSVGGYMNDILESFDFPYTARVNESFGIDIYDSAGHLLPSISGGQKVMIGFSLRLALHNMFGSAFPMMIIDEGSYGLAADATKKYFEIIAKLNKEQKFKQVIIIDHHPELTDYVDNTITL